MEVEIDCLTTVDEVEQRTSLDFFRELPDAAENTREADYGPKKFVFSLRR